jgi:hypothetical protein
MKTKHYKIVSISFKWIFVVALGYLLILLTFQVFQGPERCFDVGRGYIIAEWPGPLWYWPPKAPKECRGMTNLLDAYIEAFMVADPWLIGRTRNGWFAVDKKAHHIYYPLPFTPEKEEELQALAEFTNIHHIYYPIASDPITAEKEIKKITGVNFLSSDLITERPTSFWWPWTYGYKPHVRDTIVYIGTGYVIIVFLVIIVRRALRCRRKLRTDTSQGKTIESQ